ncbi:MAG: hypothetical protein KIT25_06395 [Enhydrobacter sp.]|nr:MAG: hypothetical protein KIT25_06395 [Enhydrobacter sp.]
MILALQRQVRRLRQALMVDAPRDSRRVIVAYAVAVAAAAAGHHGLRTMVEQVHAERASIQAQAAPASPAAEEPWSRRPEQPPPPVATAPPGEPSVVSPEPAKPPSLWPEQPHRDAWMEKARWRPRGEPERYPDPPNEATNMDDPF